MTITKLLTAAAVSLALLAAPVYADPVTIFDSEEKSLAVEGIDILDDYQGNPSYVVIMTYTNKTSKPSMALMEYTLTVYQGGVELSTTFSMNSTLSSLTTASMTQVKNGASVKYAELYKLNDLTSDLEMEFSDSLWGGKTISIPIEISKLTGEEKAPETETETEAIDWEAKYYELLVQYETLKAQYDALLEKTGNN